VYLSCFFYKITKFVRWHNISAWGVTIMEPFRTNETLRHSKLMKLLMLTYFKANETNIKKTLMKTRISRRKAHDCWMVVKCSKIVYFNRLHLSDTVKITFSILKYAEFFPSDDNKNIFYLSYVNRRPSIFFKVLPPRKNLIADTLFVFWRFGFKLRPGDRLSW
jgi:hypothetical protein